MTTRSKRNCASLVVGLLVLAGGTSAALAAPPNWVAPPETVAPDLGDEVATVIDNQGNAYAAWIGRDPDRHVFVSHRPAGGPWSAPVNATPDDLQRASSPQLAVNASGAVVLTWLRSVSSGGATPNFTVSARVKPAGTTSFGPVVPNGSPTGPIDGLDVVVDDAGTAYAAWRVNNSATPDTVQVRALVSGAWEGSGPFQAGTGVSGDPPSIATNGAGRVVVVHTDGFNVSWTSRLPGATSWANLTPLSLPGTQSSADVDLAPNGTAYFTWQTDTATVGTGSAIQGSTTISADAATSTGMSPRIGVDAGGNAHLVYAVDPGLGLCSAITHRTRSAAGVLSAETAFGFGGFHDVDVNANGDLTATWAPQATSIMLICNPPTSSAAIQRPAAGPFGQTVTFPNVGAPTGRTDAGGHINASANAVAAAIVDRLVGPFGTIRVAGFDNSVPALTGLSVPASAAPGQVVSMSVGVADNWLLGPTTTWNFGDGTTATGTSVTHAYGTAGTFTVTASHTDAVGFTATATAPVVVTSPATPGTQPGPQPTPKLASKAKVRVLFGAPTFRIRSLTLSKTTGARVSVRCLRGCKVRKAVSPKTANFNIASLFARKRLTLPGVIEVRVTKPSTIGTYFRFTMKGRKVSTRTCEISLAGKLTSCVGK